MADENRNTDRMTEKQKVKELTDRLEEGLTELFESEKYKSYLGTMSKFHNYSANNIQLIAMQRPDATFVAGYKAWQKNFERHVNKGEKGIHILAPAPYKIKEEREKTDPVTNEPMLDRDGMPVMEEVEIKIPAFRVVTVFDVAQTDGKELPGLGVNELHGNVGNYQDFMEALSRVSPVPISYEEMEGDRKGYFLDLNHPIAIKEGMSEAQTVKTGIHETAHAKLHAKEARHGTEKLVYKDRETKEVEAESIAYTVCQHFGIDTSDYSFGYIAGWSSGKEMPELKSSLDTIRRTSSELIRGIETQLLEIEKEKAAEQAQEEERERANKPIEYADVVVRISTPDSGEYETIKITNMQSEVQNALYDLPFAEDNEWNGSVTDYLAEKGFEFVPIMRSGGVNDGYPQFYDFDVDMTGKEIHEASELSAMQQAEQLINRMEFHRSVYESDERNLIMNHAYKLDDMGQTTSLAFSIAEQKDDLSMLMETKNMAQAEIDFLPDGMVGLSKMHEYGYSWNEMLPLTKDRASELFGEDVAVYRLHADGSETLVENKEALQAHDGLFGVQKDDWSAYLEFQSMKQELEESAPNREMLPEEVKMLVKERFASQLKSSGIDDVSLYMDRFDALYEQGKMEHLMPKEEEKRVSVNVLYDELIPIDYEGLMEKAEQAEKNVEVTLTVAECGEFHNLGEYHEGIAGVKEAVAVFHKIPPERRNGIPSIGINIHTEGTESYEDTQMDIVSGKSIDLEMLAYYPEITGNQKAMAVISELVAEFPDAEIMGSLEQWQSGNMQHSEAEPDADKAALLAAEIDQLSYDYDTTQYRETVDDREAQAANIAEDIRNGNTEYLNDFLNAMISDSMREGITDIFGKGTEIDNSEGVQTARKAKELLDRLAEYKPLAKIEELEECNYNMIDNVLNNEKPKEEKEKQTGRISIKEKLAEKKAVIEQRDKAGKGVTEKGTEKESGREI